ncbi:MAG: nucleotide sugar dehydrogenase [Haloarculaceae archaeon]
MSESRNRRGLYAAGEDDATRRAALTGGEVPVAVHGLGKMGLPLAAVYADVTGNVTGVDPDEAVVAAVERGDAHVTGEPGLDDLVGSVVADGSLSATSDSVAAARDASVHVVIVPTLVDDAGDPDLSIVETVTRNVARGLDPGDLVVYESTLPPTTCRETLVPLLKTESGLDDGTFGVAVCPERTSSGRALEDIRRSHPKIVGGVDEESTRAAALVYDEITENDVVAVSDATTAEAVKVFEGVYRDVNIALANELGRHADPLGIDVLEAIDAANTQPYCDLHDPGAGVGGHCIPYYPRFLIGRFDADTSLMETAREVNDAMPGYTADLALDGLAEEGVPASGAAVLVLGATYRPGVDEIRKTPALPIVEHLTDAGASVTVADPILSERAPFRAAGASVVDGVDDRTETYDAVVLVTPQEAFADLDVRGLAPPSGDRRLVVVDGRGALTALRDADATNYLGVGLDD